MSLYREAGQERRQGLIAAGIALVIGLGVGFLLGNASSDEPSFDEAITALRSDMSPVPNGLELLGGEYPQGVQNGEVVAQAEYEGSVSNLERIQATIADHTGDLEQLDPEATAALAATVDELQQAVIDKADEKAVDQLRTEATERYETILPAG